jgi:hypothetical protein
MAHKRKKWTVGDLFKVPLNDGTASLGHIVGQERSMMNSVTCAFYAIKVSDNCPPDSPPSPTDDALIACVFTTHDLISRGFWPIIGQLSPQLPRKYFPYEDCREKGWVGATMQGSGNMREFVNAFYGLAPWNGYFDPNYFDKLLIDPSKRPKNLLFIKK